jgi:hypothetical protein
MAAELLDEFIGIPAELRQDVVDLVESASLCSELTVASSLLVGGTSRSSGPKLSQNSGPRVLPRCYPTRADSGLHDLTHPFRGRGRTHQGRLVTTLDDAFPPAQWHPKSGASTDSATLA